MKREDELAGELRAAAEERAFWRALLELPAWQRFVQIIQEQRNVRASTVCLQPISSLGQALAQEFMKGEYGGLGLAITLPQTQLEVAEINIERLNQEIERDQDVNTIAKASEDGRSRVDDEHFYRE